jgi:hypothetical protein
VGIPCQGGPDDFANCDRDRRRRPHRGGRAGHAGNIYINYLRDSVAQQWSGWQQIANRLNGGPMTLDYNADGRLTLFMREATGVFRLWCTSQIAINSTAWEAIWTLLSLSAVSRYGIARDLTP